MDLPSTEEGPYPGGLCAAGLNLVASVTRGAVAMILRLGEGVAWPRWRARGGVLLAVSLAGCMVPPSAWASQGGAADREVVPGREIERPVHLAEGWTEVQLRGAHHRSRRVWSSGFEGERIDGARWEGESLHLAVRHGLRDNVELRGAAELHRAGLRQDASHAATYGMGDLVIGLRYALLGVEPPLSSVAVELDLRSPPAPPSPTWAAGQLHREGAARFATGTWSTRLGVIARRQLSPFSLTGHLSWHQRLPGQVSLSTESRGSLSWLQPGSGADLRAAAALQLSPFVLHAEARGGYLLPARAGTASGRLGLWSDGDAARIEGSEGWWLEASLGLQLHVTRALDLRAAFHRSLAGPGPALVPLISSRGLDFRRWELAVDHRF